MYADFRRRGCEKIGTGTFATVGFRGLSPFRLGASPIFSQPCRLAATVLLLLVVAAPVRADEAADAYKVALDHFSQGRWQLAEQELSEFLDRFARHPEAATAAFLLAETQIQSKNYLVARQGFLDFLTREPGHRYARRALFRSAEAARLAGLPDEAYRDFQQFRQDYPHDALNAYVLYHLGEIALARGDLVESQAFYREGLRAYPGGPLNEETRFSLGRCLEIQGDVDAARDEYRTLARQGTRLGDDAQVQLGNSFYTRGRYEEAAVEFQQAVTKFAGSPRLPQARYWLGMSHIALRRWPEAIATLTACIADHPEHELAPTMTFWLAEAHRQNGDSVAALTLYERTAANWPTSPWADDSLLALIEALFADGQFDVLDRHAAEFERDHRTSPLRPRVRQIVGRTRLKQQRFDEAVEILRGIVDKVDGDEPGEAGEVPVETPETLAAEQQAFYYLAQAYLGVSQPEAALQALTRIDPQSAKPETLRGVRVTRATALIGTGQFTEAIPLLEQTLADRENPADAAASRFQLAIARARTGQLDSAVAVSESLSDDDQQHPLVWQAMHEVAEAAYTARRFEIAEAFFRRLTSSDAPPDHVAKGWSGLGWVHYQTAKYDASAAAFGQVCDGHPDSGPAAEAQLMRAKSLERLGRRDEALEGFLALIAARNEAPQLPTALFEAAGLLEAKDEPAAALDLLVRLISQHPAFEQMDAALYRQAWLLVDLQRPAEAAEVFQTISDRHRTSRYWADATYRLAERAARAERYADATRLLNVVADAPGSSPEILGHALYLQGQVAASSGQWDRVAPPLERLLAELPDSPLRLPAEYWLAESYFQQQQFDRAAEAFSRLEPAVDQRRDPWLAMIPLRRAQILVEQQRWDEAHAAAESVAQRFPGFRQQYEADYILGRCLAMKAQFQEARQWYERVIRSPEGGKTETAAKAQWMIGESYLHQKNYAEAIRAYHRVESLFAYPRWQAAALLQAGKCYEQQGERDEASLVFTRLVEQYPETAFAREASQRLRQPNP
jgi:cellulose synthase operon protein C